MRRARWNIIVAAALLLGAASAGHAVDLEKQVERLADKHQSELGAAQPDDEKGDCRWVTQTVTHQGVAHTRRIRTCEHPSWWAEWLGKARRSK